MSRGREVALDRLRHIRAAADHIADYVARGRAAFDGDGAIRDAILYQIGVIGEAAKAVVAADASMAAGLPGVEWSLWSRMRDRLTHQYWATDPEIVWSTAARDVPDLRKAVAAVLDDAL